MKHIYLSVETQSPLAIRSDHAEGGSATAQYIPGSTMLGALASFHRMVRPEPVYSDQFEALFLKEQVFYPALYPASFARSELNFTAENLPIMPLPRTARSCKRFSGFKPVAGEDELDSDRHGIRDSLLDWGVFALLSIENQPVSRLLAPLDWCNTCAYPDCEQAMDHVNGYYRRDRYEPTVRMKAETKTHLQTRTGINRDRGTVEDGILYNREVFNEGMHFWGDVILPDETSDQFVEFLEEIDKEGLLHIGTGRTRGLGKIKIHEPYEAPREGLTSFKEKLDRFNRAFQKQAEGLGVKTLRASYFSITLYSPAILCDAFLRYRKTLDAAALARELRYSSDKPFQQMYQSTAIKRITGWNEVWGTPRPHDYALEAGSTFLFASEHELTGELLQKLYELEEIGIGRRRAEGFGRICISDPFHLEIKQA